MSQFHAGQWVTDKQFGRLGFITNIDSYDQMCGIKWIRSKWGNPVRASSICNFDEIEPAPLDIQDDDLSALIDLALDRKDSDWFTSLVERMVKDELTNN